jgi:hypothetical protein
MKTLPDGPEKQKLIDEMVKIVREDAPWTMGFYPYASAAAQRWVHNYKPAILVRDHGRYLRLDVQDRVASLAAWNKPVWWPLALIVALALALVAVARSHFRRRERTNARGEQVLVGSGAGD